MEMGEEDPPMEALTERAIAIDSEMLISPEDMAYLACTINGNPLCRTGIKELLQRAHNALKDNSSPSIQLEIRSHTLRFVRSPAQ